MSCSCLNNCSKIYTAATGSIVGTIQYYNIYCVKLCDLICREVFYFEVTAVASGTNTAVMSTQCSGTLPLFKASDGTAVVVTDLTPGLAYKTQIMKVNGVVRGVVLGL